MLSKLWTKWRTFRTTTAPRAATKLRTLRGEGRRTPLVEILEDRLAPAVAVTATMDDQTSALVSPGGTVDYKVVISNTGTTDATGVQYVDTVDPGIISGTVKVTPIAFDDAYSTVGNARLTTTAATGLLANDVDPDDPFGIFLRRVTVKTDSVTQVGGSVSGSTLTVGPDGSFIYDPGVGATGVERFQYTIVDNDSQTSLEVGFVDFTVSGRVWYVDNSAPEGGDGRQNSPFNSLAALNDTFNDVDGPDDYIYVAKGSGPYVGGLTLESGQHLIAAGASLIVGGKTLLVGNAANTPTISNDTSYTLGLSSNNDIHGVAITNSAGVGIAGISGGSLTIGGAAIDGVSINVNGGIALSLAGYNANVALTNLTSINSNNFGVRLQDVSGTLNLGTGQIIGSGAGGFLVAAGAADVNYGGGIVNSAGKSVIVQNKKGGVVTFSGPITGTAGSTGVSLLSNSGTTINFSGDLNLTTTSNDAFTATGGGTVNATSANNTLAATTGIALNVANTTIGAGNLKFKSISAGTATNGPTSGIVLNNTGSTGSLIITGDGNATLGGNSSGGTIQRTSSHGISLTNTLNPSITNINVHDIGRSGVFGAGVTNFTLANSTIDNVNISKTATDNNVSFNRNSGSASEANVAGAVSITKNILNRSFRNGLDIVNSAGTISNLTITGNSLTSAVDAANSQGAALKIVAGQGTAAAAQILAGTISGNTIANFPGGSGIVVQGGGTAALPAVNIGTLAKPVIIDDNTIAGTGPGGTEVLGGNGIDLKIGHLSTGYFTVGENQHGNTINNVAGSGIAVNQLGTGTLKASIAYNTISAHNLAGAPGIAAIADAATSNDNTPKLYLDINNNQVSNTQGEGIYATVRNTDGTGNFKIENNTVLAPSGAGLKHGIRVDSGNGNEATGAHVILKITGNTTAGSTSGTLTNPGIGLRQQHTGVVSTFDIEGLTPSPANDAQLSAYVGNTGQNPGSANGRFGANGVVSISSGATFTSKPVTFPLLADPTSGVVANTNPATVPNVASSVAPRKIRAHRSPSAPQSNFVTASLTQSQLDAIVVAAEVRWAAAGLTAEQIAILQNATYSVSGKLSAGYLGATGNGRVDISPTGGGYGWFVDATPLDDSEFPNADATRLSSTSNLTPAGHFDLLTTVVHEMGHLLGLDDLYGAASRNDLMFGALTFGERRLPFAGEATGATVNAANSAEFLGLPITIGTLPAGKRVGINFTVAVPNSFSGAPRIAQQGTVTGSNFAPVLTDDPNTAAVGDPTVTNIFILDPLAVSVSVAPGSVSEDGTVNLVYTFSRLSAVTNPLTVNFVYTGSASLGSDYIQSGASNFAGGVGAIVIPAGRSSASVTIDPIADTTSEPDETVVITVTAGANYNPSVLGPAFGTILSDDTDVTVVATSSSALEDSDDNLVFVFTRVGVLNSPLTVNFDLAGIAALGTDYTATGADLISATAGTVTFAAGSDTVTVTLDPSVDKIAEPDETVIVNLTTGAGYRVGAPAAATATIRNDDLNVSVAVSPGSVLEDGTPNLVYTFTRTGGASTPLTVNFSFAGSATLGSDYIATGADSIDADTGVAAITFAAGSTTAVVTVNPASDTEVETDETVIVALVAGPGYDLANAATATGTIASDDTNVTVSASGSALEDGSDNLVYTFTRVGGIANALTVNFAVGGTATFATDYVATGATTISATAGVITFAAGSATATLTIDPTVDATVEPDEIVVITLTPGTGYNTGSPATAASIITNDDSTVSLTVSPATVDEAGAGLLAYTFTRGGATTLPLTVSFGVAGSATLNTDYTTSGAATFTALDGTVSFAPGSNTATILVDPIADSDGESDETVILSLTAAPGYNIVAPTAATGAIIDQSPKLTIDRIALGSLGESSVGTPFQFVITRGANLTNAATINFTVSGTATNAADFTVSGVQSFDGANGTVIIPAGQTNSPIIAITPVGDALVEANETIVIAVAPGSGFGVGTPASQTVTILDDDIATASIAKTKDGAEAATAINGTFRVTLSKASSTNTVIAYTTTGTATAGSDYTALTGSVTVPAGALFTDINVAVLNDTVAESTETVVVTLSSITSGDADITIDSAANAASLDIANIGPVVSVAQVTDGAESATPTSGKWRVSVSQTSTSATVVAYTVAGTATSGSDYTTLSGSISIPAGSLSADINVAVLNDTLVEGTENIDLTLTSVSGGATGIAIDQAKKTATVKIVDNDTATLAIAPTASIAEEGGTQSIPISLTTSDGAGGTATLGTGVTLSASVVDLLTGTARSGIDYTAFGTQTVTFTAGDANGATKNATLAPINNTALDGNRTVKLKLQNLSTSLSGQASLGVVDSTATIVDEDATPPVANLSGILFTDYDADGRHDSGETGISGRTVFLDQNNNGVADASEAKATTGAGGAYSFTGVAPGTYKLRLQTFGFETAVGVNGSGVDLVLAARTTRTGIDLGLRPGSAVAPLPIDAQAFPGATADDDAALIQGYYHALLGRAGDAAGVTFWVNQLHATSRQTVAQNFLDLDEFRGLQIRQYYERIFGRAASAADVSFWVGQMKASRLSSTDIATQFLTGQEFTNNNPTSQQFVEALYRVLLGRVADSASVNFWTSQLNSGALTRTGVVQAFFDSSDSRGLALDAVYAQLLQRAIEPEARTAYLPSASTGFGIDQVIISLLSSDEFARRTA